MGIIAKQGIRGTIVTYIGVAVGFVTTFFVITRFLTTEEIGLARVLIDAATLFVGLAQLGTSTSIIRFFPYFKDDKDNHGFFFWTVVVPLIGFAVLCLIYWLCATPLQHWFGDKSPLFIDYYYMVLPIAFFMLYQTVFETNSNVLMHIVVPRAVREIGVRVVLLALYLMYAFRILSLDGFVIGLCLDYAIAAFINLGYLFSLGRISLKPDLTFIRQNIDIVKSYGLYTGFLIVAALTSVLAPTLSSFFITAQMGLNYTGIFAIATYIAVMVSIPSRSICAIAQPELSAAIKNSDKDSINRLVAQASNNLLLVGGLILLVIWVNIDLIFHILPNGETYAVAKHTVLLLGIGQLMVSTFSIFIPLLNYSRYYAFSLLNSAVLTTSAIFFNNMLIPQFGMNGAAFATVIADIIYYILVVGISCTAMRVMPFSRRQLVTLTLIVSLFVVNKLWQVYMPIDNIWFDSIARTIVLGSVALWIIVKADLSPEFHALLSSLRVYRN